MAVFRCPSGSFSSDESEHSQASSSAHKKSKGKGKAKATDLHYSSTATVRPSDADLTMKKARRERIVQVRGKKLSYVFVGNISRATTEWALADMFSICGRIDHVSIRCSADPTNACKRGEGPNYAVVVFRDPLASVRALKKHGTQLNGCSLVVCPTVDDLPDITRLAEKRAAQNKRQLRGVPTLVSNSLDELGG
ncbi:hypothetical protein DFH11DRAFT_673948 [Phellopilus nigrolimitatus]|nr:hypothetical protein DFH11DRAFT_673948 [Phellopilus nigrolimitatus]